MRCDEAGGTHCRAGVCCAVILDPDHPIDGLKDSKKLSENRRDELAQLIKEKAKAWSIAQCSVAEIDELNILWASMLAMKRAIERLSIKPELALIDGNRCPKELSVRARAIVKGDDRIPVYLCRFDSGQNGQRSHHDGIAQSVSGIWF